MAALDVVVVAACREVVWSVWRIMIFAKKRELESLPVPTPEITKDRTALMVGNCLTDAIVKEGMGEEERKGVWGEKGDGR